MSEESISADVARNYLRQVEPPWKSFWLHMHLVAYDLEQFAAGLEQIDDATFTTHNSGQKNDFAAWVSEVVGDTVLARQLLSVRNQAEAAAAVRQRVAELKEIVNK